MRRSHIPLVLLLILASACQRRHAQQDQHRTGSNGDTMPVSKDKRSHQAQEKDTADKEIILGYPYSVISDPTDKLSDKTDTLTLERIEFACECPNWITIADRKKYENTDSFDKKCLYLQAADTTQNIPFYFDPYRHRVIVTGHYYQQPYYTYVTMRPGDKPQRKLSSDKVFRYNTLRTVLMPSQYLLTDDTVITFEYNAIACECAQWTNQNGHSALGKVHCYLERGNPNAPDADKLWTGDNLPLIVEARGHFVSVLPGYPDGYTPHKGHPDPAPVFRYSSLRVISNGSTNH